MISRRNVKILSTNVCDLCGICKSSLPPKNEFYKATVPLLFFLAIAMFYNTEAHSNGT